MRTEPRYRAQRLPLGHAHAGEYGIRDMRTGTYVDKFGRPDGDYYAATLDVAKMRTRDLNSWERERVARLPEPNSTTYEAVQRAIGALEDLEVMLPPTIRTASWVGDVIDKLRTIAGDFEDAAIQKARKEMAR